MITTGIAGTIDRTNPEEVARLYKTCCTWGVPEREVALVFDGLTDTTALTFTKEWLADQTPMLVLAGPKGVGKTIAAAYAIMHADPPPPAGFARWPNERGPKFRHISEVAELGLYDKDGERKARAEIKTSKCLVIDDVGVEYMNDVFLALWDSIVNARYGAMGRTIFTTNLTAQMFADRYGGRVYDRIKGRGAWFDIDEQSMRGATT